jgi:hypothetical protein
MIEHVGRLAPADLRGSFEARGRFSAASVPTSTMERRKPAGPGRGFGFVAPPDPRAPLAAAKVRRGQDLLGRTLEGREARTGRTLRRLS